MGCKSSGCTAYSIRAAVVLTLIFVFGAVIVGEAAGITYVSNCTIINQSGYYLLTQDLIDETNYSVNSVCIYINSSDVILDGGSHLIDGTDAAGSYGVLVHNATTTLTNVTIKNLRVSDWNKGIGFDGVENSTVTDSELNSNMYGLVLSYSDNNTVSGLTVTNSYYDAYRLEYSSNNTLYNLTATGNGNGLVLYYSNTNTVENLSTSRHSGVGSGVGAGIRIVVSHYNLIANASVTDSNYMGVYLSSSNGNTIRNVSVSDSDNTNIPNAGIYLYSSNSNVIVDNTVTCGWRGIHLINSIGNSLDSNSVSNTILYGIRLESSNSNTLSHNTLSNNPWDFNSTSSSSGNRILFNNFSGVVASFEYSGNISVRYAQSPASDPANYRNIGKYLEVKNDTWPAWVFLNISYEDSDRTGLIESTLRMWKYDGATWSEVPGVNGVNTAQNYVYANITDFSVFAPFGTWFASECSLIDTPGTYYLANDILNAGTLISVYDLIHGSSQACIYINSSDVTFYGNGHVIDGTGSATLPTYGVFVFSNNSSNILSNVVVKDLTVKEWYYDGVFFDYVRNVRVENVAAKFNGKDGFHVRHSDNVVLKNITSADNGKSMLGSGVYFMRTNYSTIVNSTITNNQNNKGVYFVDYSSHNYIGYTNISLNYYGLYLTSNGVNLTIENNTVTSNYDGIYIWGPDSNTIRNNDMFSNQASGLYLRESDNNTVNDNNATGNKWGIQLYLSHQNEITNNTLNSNSDYGLYILNSNYNVVENNSARANGNGIYLYNSHDNHFTGNTISNNEYGLVLVSPTNITCDRNVFSDNNISDFKSAGTSSNTSLNDNQFGNVEATFTYSGGISLKSVSSPASPPSGYAGIGKYLKITNQTPLSWVFLNISYSSSDIKGIVENSLRMWRYDGSSWSKVPGTNGVNPLQKYVYANITEFSVFAPLGLKIQPKKEYYVGEGGMWIRPATTPEVETTPVVTPLETSTPTPIPSPSPTPSPTPTPTPEKTPTPQKTQSPVPTVTGEEKKPEQGVSSEKMPKGIPGFEFISAILAILAISIVRRRN